MHTTLSTAGHPGLAWPLLTTRHPNAHLTWAEWLAYRASTGSSAQGAEPAAGAQPHAAQLRSATWRDRDTSARPDWPLPGTKVPNGRLTWTQWLTYQAKGIAAREPQPAAPGRAA